MSAKIKRQTAVAKDVLVTCNKNPQACREAPKGRTFAVFGYHCEGEWYLLVTESATLRGETHTPKKVGQALSGKV